MGSASGGGRVGSSATVTYKGKTHKATVVGKNRYEFRAGGKSKTIYIRPKASS